MNQRGLARKLLNAIAFIAASAAAAAATALILRFPEPQIYDFEDLKIGDLQEQDGWPTVKVTSELYRGNNYKSYPEQELTAHTSWYETAGAVTKRG